MAERAVAGGWHRIERTNWRGHVLDYVEVAQCATCGCGVDREFRHEYREVEGAIYCTPCARPLQLPMRGLTVVGR